MSQRAARSQEGAEKSRGHRVTGRAKSGQEDAGHSGRHRVNRMVLNGHVGVEWPGSRTDRRASSALVSLVSPPGKSARH